MPSNRIIHKSAVLLAFLMLTACNNDKKPSYSSVSGYTQADIIGEWYSGEIGGSFCFSEDNILYLKVDMSNTMYMSSDNIMHITDSDEDYSDGCTFDGKNYSFEINGIDMITMSRDMESESAYGEYTLRSGVMYEELSSQYGNLDGRYNIIADNDIFDAKIRICEFETNDRNKITFSGDDLEFFGADTEQISVFNFAVQNNVLTLIGADNSTLVFSKVD